MEHHLEPETKRELRATLDEVISNAFRNDIEVADHAYPLRHESPSMPDWQVVIERTTKPGQ